jgi:hypothetical protein
MPWASNAKERSTAEDVAAGHTIRSGGILFEIYLICSIFVLTTPASPRLLRLENQTASLGAA